MRKFLAEAVTLTATAVAAAALLVAAIGPVHTPSTPVAQSTRPVA